MKHALIAGLLSLALPFSSAYSQNTQPECGSTKDVFTFLKSKYNEIPMWIGKLGERAVMVSGNNETKTWSIVQFDKQTACVMAYGKDFESLLEYFQSTPSL